MRGTIFTIIALIITFATNAQKQSSNEILKKFHTMELSFRNANANVDTKNKMILKAIGEQAEIRQDEVKPYYQRALEVKKVSTDFVKYIEDLKKNLVIRAGGRKEPEDGEPASQTELKKPDDIEDHVNYLFKHPDDAKAKELTMMVDSTRIKLLALLNDGNGVIINQEDRENVIKQSNLLTTYDTKNYASWAEMYFKHSPLAGVVTMLTKLQNDSRNMEADIIETLAKNIDKEKVVFDNLEAIVIPESNMVMVGQEYKAKVMLVASDSKSKNPVLVSGRALPMEDGKGIYTARPSAMGNYNWEGTIEVKDNDKIKSYPFSATYQALNLGAVISADAMNVLYIGLDNPVSVSVVGFPQEDIIATIVNGTLTKTDHGYIAKVFSKGQATISVNVKQKDGSVRPMGEKTFRTRNIPTPEPSLGTLESGTYLKTVLLAQTTIYAAYNGFTFEGVKINTISYTASFINKNAEVQTMDETGPLISSKLRALIGGAKTGDKIIFDKIVAEGPAGKMNLTPLVITVQ